MKIPGSERSGSWAPVQAENCTSTLSWMGSRKRSILARIGLLRGSGTRGSALVEMALSLPIMLGIMTGIFSFSIALYQKLELAEAVSNGGRVLAVDRGDSDPCDTTAKAIYAAAPTLNSSGITLNFVLNGVSSGASCPGSGGGANPNLVAGESATVSATYTCSINIYGYSYPGCTLGTQITETVQ